jgi:hypothetical protein
MKEYEGPAVTDLGSLAELTQGGPAPIQDVAMAGSQ